MTKTQSIIYTKRVKKHKERSEGNKREGERDKRQRGKMKEQVSDKGVERMRYRKKLFKELVQKGNEDSLR